MTAQTRTILKGYFQRGNKPTQSQYGDLIDSFLVSGEASMLTSAQSLAIVSGYAVAKAGDTMTGLLILSGDPVVSAGATTKQYVDSAINTVSAAAAAKAPLSGATFTGTVITTAAAAGGAGLRIPHGTAPSSPVNGDLWTTTSGLYSRINSSTYELQKRELYVLGGEVGILGSGFCRSTTNARIFIPFKFRLTTAPTGITVANVTSFAVQNSSAVDQAASSITFVSATKDGIQVDVTVSSGLVAGNGTVLNLSNANGTITLTGGAI